MRFRLLSISSFSTRNPLPASIFFRHLLERLPCLAVNQSINQESSQAINRKEFDKPAAARQTRMHDDSLSNRIHPVEGHLLL